MLSSATAGWALSCTYEALAKDIRRIAAKNGEMLQTDKSAVSGAACPAGQGLGKVLIGSACGPAVAALVMGNDVDDRRERVHRAASWLPELSVVIWPEPSENDQRDERAGLHWKTRALVDWAAGRAFAWADDEITDADRAWVSAHHCERALLHRVDPAAA